MTRKKSISQTIDFLYSGKNRNIADETSSAFRKDAQSTPTDNNYPYYSAYLYGGTHNSLLAFIGKKNKDEV